MKVDDSVGWYFYRNADAEINEKLMLKCKHIDDEVDSNIDAEVGSVDDEEVSF